MSEVPSDYVKDILERIINGKVDGINIKIKDVKDDIAEIKITISANHDEVKDLLSKHITCCGEDMRSHESRIRGLEAHKNMAIGALGIMGFVVTVMAGYLILLR